MVGADGRGERLVLEMESEMIVEFRVHTVAEARANVRTEVEGEMLTASIPCVEVELTTVQERSGTLTLRFVTAMDEARQFFTADKIVHADFREGAAPKAAPEEAKA